MVDSWSYTQVNLIKDETYNIGFNDGREFVKMKYIGTKLLNGKSMLCFKTEELLDVTINPSYVSFYLQETTTTTKEEKGVNKPYG